MTTQRSLVDEHLKTKQCRARYSVAILIYRRTGARRGRLRVIRFTIVTQFVSDEEDTIAINHSKLLKSAGA